MTISAKLDECFPGTRAEDLIWLSSLSESEIDMLISLKLLVLQRAKMVGDSELATKFDLKMLRAIGFVLMEYLKAQVQGSSLVPDIIKSGDFLDASNLLKWDSGNVVNIEEISALSSSIGVDLRNILGEHVSRVSEPKRKKQKV